MKVIATFKDGHSVEILISETALHRLEDAIATAKHQLKPEELEQVAKWEIEEEFL